MVRARLSSKGQITVPVEIRRRFGLRTGDEIDFRTDDAGVRMLPVRKRPLSELRGMFPVQRGYPGKDTVRREIGRMLGEQLDRKIRRMNRRKTATA